MNFEPEPPQKSARTGDRDAIGALWREHRSWVAAVLFAHMPRGAELDDLLQEVATIVVEQIVTLRDPDKLRPWLRTVAINVAKGYARRDVTKRRAIRPFGEGEEEWIPDRRGSAQLAASAELQNLLLRLQSLPPEYSEPLLLQSMNGMSQKQIAAALGVPETTVETRLARARRALREQTENKHSAQH
ncbi:MAG: RNA polymerase sigma factor [Planctomycetota bacterium]